MATTKNMMLTAAAYPSFVAAYALLAWVVQYEHLPAPSVITVIVPGVLCALTFIVSDDKTSVDIAVLHAPFQGQMSEAVVCEVPTVKSQPGSAAVRCAEIFTSADYDATKMPAALCETVVGQQRQCEAKGEDGNISTTVSVNTA